MTTINSLDTNYARDTDVKAQNFPSKAHSPKTSTSDRLEVSKDVTTRVKRVPPTRAFNTIRFLLSKVCFEGKLSDTEELLLYHYFSEVDALGDPCWQIKRGIQLSRLKFLIQCYQRIISLNTATVQDSFWKIARGFKYRELLHTQRAYFGRKKVFNVKNFLVRNNRKLRSNPPPQRFVGVGYGDHGTCRKPELDASHSWQELAVKQESFSQPVEPYVPTGPELAAITAFGRRNIQDINIKFDY